MVFLTSFQCQDFKPCYFLGKNARKAGITPIVNPGMPNSLPPALTGIHRLATGRRGNRISRLPFPCLTG